MAANQSTSSSITSPKEMALKFKEILKSNGILDPISEVISSDPGLQGENWCAKLGYVTVNFENPSKKPLHLFVKNALDNQLQRDWEMYKRETVFFMEYLPLARDYCKRVGCEELMDIYPKCFYGDENMIILENLVMENGFILLRKEEQQDFETAKLALTSLAKHHALSHALIQEFGGAESFFHRFPVLKFDAFVTESNLKGLCSNLDNGIDVNVTLLEGCGIEGSDKAIATLKSLKGKIFNDVSESLNTNRGKFFVLNHGDYWNNNMMFLKDSETNRITHQICVDFAAVKYASPCLDLSFYLFTSAKPNVRREKFHDLLPIYLAVLKITTEKLGYPVDMSLKDLEEDFGKHFYYSFFIGLGFQRAVFEVQADLEFKTSNDDCNIREKFHKFLQKWIENNPEKCKEDGRNIIDYVKMYEQFHVGNTIE